MRAGTGSSPGAVKNQLTYTVGTLALAVTLYDSRGSVLDVARAKVGTTILSPATRRRSPPRSRRSGWSPIVSRSAA